MLDPGQQCPFDQRFISSRRGLTSPLNILPHEAISRKPKWSGAPKPVGARDSDICVVSLQYVTLIVLHHRSMPTHSRAQHPNERQHSTNYSDDHQDDTDRVDVETVLVRTDGERKVQNCTHCESNNARY